MGEPQPRRRVTQYLERLSVPVTGKQVTSDMPGETREFIRGGIKVRLSSNAGEPLPEVRRPLFGGVAFRVEGEVDSVAVHTHETARRNRSTGRGRRGPNRVEAGETNTAYVTGENELVVFSANHGDALHKGRLIVTTDIAHIMADGKAQVEIGGDLLDEGWVFDSSLHVKGNVLSGIELEKGTIVGDGNGEYVKVTEGDATFAGDVVTGNVTSEVGHITAASVLNKVGFTENITETGIAA